MSAAEGSISGSTGSGAAPPPAAPAAAPVDSAPQPVAAPDAPVSTPATPAATGPAAPPADAAAMSQPGALPSKPQPLTSLDAVHQRFREQKAEIAAKEAAQPEATAPVQAQPTPAPIEAQPAEPVAAPVDEPLAALPTEEPAPAVEAESSLDTGDLDLETVLTLEDLVKQYPRVPKATLTDFAKREAHRGELQKTFNAIGGEPGVKFAEIINPIIWDNENPTTADVDTVLDQIVDTAGAVKFFDLMGKHVVQTQMDDPVTGPAFAENLITGKWGKKADGTSFDFWGMKPLECIDLLVRGAQYQDAEGNGLISKEFLAQELNGNASPEPTAKELELQKKVEELTSVQQAKEAEQIREREQHEKTYNTQAKGFVSNYIMKEVMPLAIKANWAAVEGEDGPNVGPKKTLGRMVSNDINTHIQSAQQYSDVMKMIGEKTAFDMTTGHPTARFLQKLRPLQTIAKARFAEIQRELGSQFQFAAQTSRAANLVKANGGQVSAPNPASPQTAVPPLAVNPTPQPNRPATFAEQMAKVRADYRAQVAQLEEANGVGVR